MILHIKHMVSIRCKMVVKQELRKLGLHVVILDLGTIEILEDISLKQKRQLAKNLKVFGLILLEDKRNILIKKLKSLITDMLHFSDEAHKVNYSEYISQKLGYDYTFLANTFSEVQGITIQQFIILKKIKRVKELLLHDDLNLTEISYKLQYSSVSHLSNQFKKITGCTPSYFKKKRKKQLRILDYV
ncbi:hypothetical protein LCGC14_1810890 [marine sediment metagenome]|uniref:HTH araC/xylS-type domain-containing protein n=1 Tax=marine sediment metagenome TaxID=412755 RepID=A0A0F9H9X2_9ZZZZ